MSPSSPTASRASLWIFRVFLTYTILLPGLATISVYAYFLAPPPEWARFLLWIGGIALVGVYLATLNYFTVPASPATALLLLLDTPLILLPQFYDAGGMNGASIAAFLVTDFWAEAAGTGLAITILALREGQSPVVPLIIFAAANALFGPAVFEIFAERSIFAWAGLAFAFALSTVNDYRVMHASLRGGHRPNEEFMHIVGGILFWTTALFLSFGGVFQ